MNNYHDDLEENKISEGIISICASCKKIRNNEGIWELTEEYNEHSEALFSHGICPDCMKKLYSDYLPQK